MSTIKEDAIQTIEKLPDNCTVSDIFERLLFLEKIREGEEEAGKGNLIDHEEVEKRFSKWLKCSCSQVTYRQNDGQLLFS